MTPPAFVPAVGYRHSIPAHPASKCARLRAPQKSRRPHRASITRVVATVVRTGDPCPQSDLESFAENIRGEWTGYEGTFDVKTAEAQPVPDFYIPEQFTEWGLIPRGFESNHSMIVRGTKLYRKFFRVLPTVSLFADHVDLEEDFSSADIDPAAGMHIFPDGSFSAGPSAVCIDKASLLDKWPKVDFCLRDPRTDAKEALHMRFSFDFRNRELVGELRAIREHYSCIYCDGADIDGSSGFVEGWVVDAHGAPEHLAGEWTVSGDDGVVQKVSRPEGGPPAAPARQLYLPQGIDVAVLDGVDGGVVTQVGWLVDDATRIVLRRSFGKDGIVTLSERIVEHRVSA